MKVLDLISKINPFKKKEVEESNNQGTNQDKQYDYSNFKNSEFSMSNKIDDPEIIKSNYNSSLGTSNFQQTNQSNNSPNSDLDIQIIKRDLSILIEKNANMRFILENMDIRLKRIEQRLNIPPNQYR